MPIYRLSKRDFDELDRKFEIFAERRFASSYDKYGMREQHNPSRIKSQTVVGCWGEEAARRFFLSLGYRLTRGMDLNIYDASKKSYLEDLTVNNVPIHVKAHSLASALMFDNSWLFENNDPLLVAPTGLIVLCSVTEIERTIEVKAVLEAEKCIPLLGSPKKSRLTSKKALYFDRIKERFGDNLICLDLLDQTGQPLA